jgi:hypothetical protein
MNSSFLANHFFIFRVPDDARASREPSSGIVLPLLTMVLSWERSATRIPDWSDASLSESAQNSSRPSPLWPFAVPLKDLFGLEPDHRQRIRGLEPVELTEFIIPYRNTLQLRPAGIGRISPGWLASETSVMESHECKEDHAGCCGRFCTWVCG